MRPRTLLLLSLAALAGAAVAVLPALAAAPSEVKLEVNENCVENDWPCWAAPSSGSKPQPASKLTIAAGGEVMFTDKTKTIVSIAWTGTAPACAQSVPVSPAPPQTGWGGKCKFEQPGAYKFESATLFNGGPGENYTKYEIVVESAAGGTTSTTTSTTTATHNDADNTDDADHTTDAERTEPQLGLAVGRRIQGAQAHRQPARIDSARVDQGVPRRLRRAAGSRPVCRWCVAGQGGALDAGARRAARALAVEGGQRVLLRTAERQGRGRVAPPPASGGDRQGHAHATTRRGGERHPRRRAARLNGGL